MAVDRSDTSGVRATGAGVYPIPLVRVTATGFIGRTERGPTDEPVPVRSFAEYHRVFGGHVDDGLVSHCVQDYFQHGGEVAVVVRVANRAKRAEIHCPAGDSALVLSARYPGSQEVLRASVDYDGTELQDSRFNLVVQRLHSAESNLIADQEFYSQISLDPGDERFIGDVIRESRLVRISGPLPPMRPDATLPDHPGAPVKYIRMSRAGSDGGPLTDYDIIGSRAKGTGLFAFDKGAPVDILCIPPPPARDTGMTVFVAAERICAARRAIYVFDPPWAWTTADRALAGARELGSHSRHVLSYYPRIRPRGERARYQGGLPACGAIAGMLAHRDSLGDWSGRCALALKNSLIAAEELSQAQVALLRRSGVNVFVRGDGAKTVLVGNTIFGGARSYASRDCHLDEMRLRCFVLKSIEDAARFALARFQGAQTLLALERRVREFLGALYEHHLLQGSIPGQAYFARVEPAVAGNAAELRFGVALEKPREFFAASIKMRPGTDPVAEQYYGVEADRLFG